MAAPPVDNVGAALVRKGRSVGIDVRLGVAAKTKTVIKPVKVVYAVFKPRVGKIAVSAAASGRSRRAGGRGKVWPEGVEKIRTRNELTVNLK